MVECLKVGPEFKSQYCKTKLNKKQNHNSTPHLYRKTGQYINFLLIGCEMNTQREVKVGEFRTPIQGILLFYSASYSFITVK
jgi:hypothetical protein